MCICWTLDQNKESSIKKMNRNERDGHVRVDNVLRHSDLWLSLIQKNILDAEQRKIHANKIGLNPTV